MKAVIQRVTKASVTVNGELISEIGKGYLVLLGVMDDDTEADAEITAKKTASLRIFEDEDEKMNLDILNVGGEVLAVSQFTLTASTRKGNLPSYIHAAGHELAIPLYEAFCEHLQALVGCPVKRGIFGADMQVSLINDGPVTIIIDSRLKE